MNLNLVPVSKSDPKQQRRGRRQMLGGLSGVVGGSLAHSHANAADMQNRVAGGERRTGMPGSRTAASIIRAPLRHGHKENATLTTNAGQRIRVGRLKPADRVRASYRLGRAMPHGVSRMAAVPAAVGGAATYLHGARNVVHGATARPKSKPVAKAWDPGNAKIAAKAGLRKVRVPAAAGAGGYVAGRRNRQLKDVSKALEARDTGGRYASHSTGYKVVTVTPRRPAEGQTRSTTTTGNGRGNKIC